MCTFAGVQEKEKMKRISTILLSTALSLIFIFATMGIEVVHCSHTQQTRVMLPMERRGCEVPCRGFSSCMKVMVSRLIPTMQQSRASFHFNAARPLLCILDYGVKYISFYQESEEKGTLNAAPSFTLPPRQYLKRLRMLII